MRATAHRSAAVRRVMRSRWRSSAVTPASGSVSAMTGMQRGSLLERLIGKPLPWLVWVWAVVALVWLVLAVVEPSRFHTQMAVLWIILAAVQIGSVSLARAQARKRARNAGNHS